MNDYAKALRVVQYGLNHLNDRVVHNGVQAMIALGREEPLFQELIASHKAGDKEAFRAAMIKIKQATGWTNWPHTRAK